MQPLIVCSMCKKVKVKFGDFQDSSVCEECFSVMTKTETMELTNVDFIAIDFETANNKMSSACSLSVISIQK